MRWLGLAPPAHFALPLAAHAGLACLALAALVIARERLAAGALCVTLGAAALLFGLARYDAALGSPRGLVRVAAENRAAGEPVVEFSRFDAGLPFYLREPVRLLEVPRESGFSEPGARARVFVTRDSLPALVDAHGRVWLLGPEGAPEALAREIGLRWQPTARWKSNALGILTR